MIRFAASTHTGLIRKKNEDCYQASPELGLWLVADGIGGHVDGEIASGIVRDAIRDAVAVGTPLLTAIAQAHQAVLAAISHRQAHSDMGSTVVACLVDKHEFELVWVGDSRGYLFNGDLQQLSCDHSPVSELIATGALSAEQAAQHPERHLLSQSLGVSAGMELQPGQVQGQLPPRGQLLLCSDGLTDELSDAEIQRLMQHNGTPQQQVDALVNAALAAGGSDNITVVVIGSGDSIGLPASHDLETTQNIGQTITSEDRPRDNHDAKIWLLIAAMMALAFWLWMG